LRPNKTLFCNRFVGLQREQSIEIGQNTKQKREHYTVVTRLEIAELEREIDKIDPGAFIIYSSISATKGEYVKKTMFKSLTISIFLLETFGYFYPAQTPAAVAKLNQKNEQT